VEFKPPVYQKTPDQKKRLEAACRKGIIFRALDDKALFVVIDAMQEREIKAGTTVIQQGAEVGDEEDGLFTLETGELNVYKAKAGEAGNGPHVHTYKNAGDSFGELALLYNCARAATVTAAKNSTLWVLQRNAFNGLVKGAVQQKREQYEAFLASVKLLDVLTSDERSKLSDVLVDQPMKVGDAIVKEGEVGDTFFIIAEGAAEASTKEKGVVYSYKAHDFFGELALRSGSDGVRKATITCTKDGKLVTIDRASFRRLCGSLDTLMEERAKQYK
jgi:cAMP-dependent protein kinase regulator